MESRVINRVMIEADFPHSIRARKLSRALDLSPIAGVGLLVSLYARVASEAEDGVITSWDDDDLADACQWSGDARQLREALMAGGFILDVDDSYTGTVEVANRDGLFLHCTRV